MFEVIWAITLMFIGLVTLVAGGEILVRGASALAAAMRISPLVIGLTVVAFGTSAPELAVALQSAYLDKTDLAIGNAVGSNIFNVLFVLGISSLIAPLIVSSQLIRWDVPLMVAASFLLLAFGWDGSLSRLEGAVMFAALLLYIVWSVRQSRRENIAIQEQFAHEIPPSGPGGGTTLAQLMRIAVGLVLLGLGSKWLVDGAVSMATRMGISELIIGLTIIAVGTSLPEVVTSVVAAWRGERDIAVGNIVGSNIFNILCVLGLSSIVAPQGVNVSAAAIHFDIPVMIAVAVACLPIFFTGNEIARWEGGLFFFYYLAYTTYLILDTTGHELSQTLAAVMTAFVVPLTVITLAVTSYRNFRQRRDALVNAR